MLDRSQRSLAPIRLSDQSAEGSSAKNPAILLPGIAARFSVSFVPGLHNVSNCRKQVFAEIALGYKSVRSDFGSVSSQEGWIVLTYKNDVGFGHLLANDASRFHTIHARHGNIHQHRVWTQTFGLVDSFQTISCFRADRVLRTGGHDEANSASHSFMVIHNQNLQCFHRSGTSPYGGERYSRQPSQEARMCLRQNRLFTMNC